MEHYYPEILREHQIDALGAPRFTLAKLTPGGPLGFTTETAVFPKFTLPDYRKIAAETKPADRKRQAIIEKLLADTTVALPEILIQKELEAMIQEIKAGAADLGLNWSDYLTRIKKTEAGLKMELRSTAEKRLKSNLLLHEIAKREGIRASPETVERETQRLLKERPDLSNAQVRPGIEGLLVQEQTWQFLESC